jgi:hypothetical protein
MIVDGSQVKKMAGVSQSKSGNVWIYDIVHCLHWLHLEPTHTYMPCSTVGGTVLRHLSADAPPPLSRYSPGQPPHRPQLSLSLMVVPG